MNRSILFLPLFFLGLPLYAQWTLCNPGHGNVYSLAVTGDTIYEGTMDGIFISDDNGYTWTESNNGLTNLIIKALFVKGTRLFAGTNEGIFVSSDRALTWIQMNEGLTGMQVSAIAANDYGLFAATLDAGVFASVNDGLSWTPVNNGLVNPEIHSITARGNELFIGTMGDGIFRSANNGAEWIPFNNGMTIPYITSLCTVGDKVFTGTMGGLYRLDQGAGTWISVNEGLLDDVLSYAVYNDLLFIGTNGSGVFYTPDNGLSWIKCNEGFSTKTIYSLAICGANIFAGQCCGNGLWKRPLEECVGISEISDPFHVILYPVPVGEFFYVGIPGEEFDGRGHLSIFSLDGTRVKETELAGLKTSVETGGLTPGSYIVRIRMEDKTVIRKITKIDTR